MNELNCTNTSPFICYFLPDDRARELMTGQREKVVDWSKSDFELFRDLLWCTVSLNLDSADKTENISHWHSKNERNEFTFSGWSRDLSLTWPPLCPARPFSTNFHVIKRRRITWRRADWQVNAKFQPQTSPSAGVCLFKLYSNKKN